MKNLLENVIKIALFESRTVGIVKSVTPGELRAAQQDGAVWMYAVLTKRTAVPAEIINIVYGATVANSATDEGNRVAVGPGSKFSNGQFIYQVGAPAEIGDNDRRQLITVQIVPMGNAKITNAKMMIGKSPMLTQAEYAAARAANKELPDVSGNVATTTGQKIAATVDKVVDKFTGKTDDATTTTQPTATQEPVVNKGYPREIDGVKVYTMADTDDYVYAKINGSWKFIEKKTFEANPKLAVITKKLNSAGIKNVEAKFGLATSNQNQGGGGTNVNQSGGGGGNQNQGSSGGDAEVKTIKKGDSLEWNRKTDTPVPLWYWDGKEFKKWYKNPAGESKPPVKQGKIQAAWYVGPTKAKFVKASSNGKYFLVNISGREFFIEKQYFKEVEIATSPKPLKSGAVLKWTNKALTDGVPTYTQGGAQPTGNRKTVKATDKIVFVSKNNSGTFYEVKWNGSNIWIPKSYLTKA